MNISKFDAAQTLSISQAGGESIEDGNLIVIIIKDMKIHTENFDSKDSWLEGGSREGTILLNLNGQETIIPFDDDKANVKKYLGKVAFLGR